MRKSFILVLIIALFLLGEYRMAYATETGKIIGTIKDANKKGLPEVTVTVTSPNLMGERTVVTNKKGRFTIPELPIGIYLLQFKHKDMKTIKRPDVKILPYATVKVKLTMKEGSPDDVEILSGPSDLIDVQSSGQRRTMESDFLQRLPGSKI
ncbi:MAG: carboxypeptidase-like regulatory domain-containing protein [bacterium]